MIKVISGGQTGADEAGLIAAQACGIATGGWMPRGWRRQDGRGSIIAKKFGMSEHESGEYPPRTMMNVVDSDATLRIAVDFRSPGEKCTMRCISKAKKPYLDIDVVNMPRHEEVVKWLITNGVNTLNVAGNAERTCPGITVVSVQFLIEVFNQWKRELEFQVSESIDIQNGRTHEGTP